ncbi:MAG: S9 family peptidase, partial [Nannocystaceae bacterium]|nr:S9 family peptidase [Nannocystaceae bacterium]
MVFGISAFAGACDSPGAKQAPDPAQPNPSGAQGERAHAPSAADNPDSSTDNPTEKPAAVLDPIAEPQPVASIKPHPFGARDMLAMDRISGHQVSPDGKTIVFVRRVTDLAADKGRTDLWIVPVAGGEPTQLTSDPGPDTAPQWTANGAAIMFLSARSGSMQVWRMPGGGGDPSQVTDLPLPVGNLMLDPTGKRIVFSLEVFPDCKDIACTNARLDADAADQRSGHVYDGGFVRHWDTYADGRRTHLYSLPMDGKGAPVSLMNAMDADAPSKPFGGTEEFTISPDGTSVVFTARDVGREEPWSTNFDLFVVPITGGTAKKLTDNLAWDTHPLFTPDGKTLIYAAMKRPGYEADRFVIQTMAWPDGPAKPLTAGWDRSPRDIVASPDGTTLWVTAQDLGQVALFSVSLADGSVHRVATGGTLSGPAVAGEQIVVSRHDLGHPAELFSVPMAGGEARAITRINAAKVSAAKMGEYEQFSFKGAHGDTVYGYVVKPSEFVEGGKYPLAFLIHGGPQGSFGNKFHYRWNPQAYAGAGYVSVMIDFHGSTGYGQAFTDSIRKDWGGAPLEDLKKGLSAALAKYTFIDGQRACALGASYGGFMINWIEGNWQDQFACLVNHDGVFDQRSMYYATEELWFPEWEQGGPYFDNAAQYEKHNPARLVGDWKTPMLVIHGSRDYRVPQEQGLAAFNALQRRGIESRYLHFPDENHWVLSGHNSLLWHETVLGWLDAHT